MIDDQSDPGSWKRHLSDTAQMREQARENKSMDNQLLIEALKPVFDEIEKAVEKFPLWPNDPLHASAILGEEYGELKRAILHVMYEPGKSTQGDVRTEVIQTAAMAIRFLLSLDAGDYDWTESIQHHQKLLSSGVE